MQRFTRSSFFCIEQNRLPANSFDLTRVFGGEGNKGQDSTFRLQSITVSSVLSTYFYGYTLKRRNQFFLKHA